MDAEVKSHLAYTFKAPSLLDHANFIESLTCTIFTVIMTIAHLDSTPPPWISLVRISEELFTIFTFLAVISAIITFPRIILWLLLPRLMNFLEKLFPVLYILSVTCLSIHKDLNSLWSSYKFTNNLHTVLESFAIGIGGFLTFKFFRGGLYNRGGRGARRKIMFQTPLVGFKITFDHFSHISKNRPPKKKRSVADMTFHFFRRFNNLKSHPKRFGHRDNTYFGGSEKAFFPATDRS